MGYRYYIESAKAVENSPRGKGKLQPCHQLSPSDARAESYRFVRRISIDKR
jgi:hypothetical protein